MKLVIEMMSGLADAELNIFESWARENVSDLTIALLDSARERLGRTPLTGGGT